ncbi:hypothetical protein [Methanoculleus sp. 7T]|uniref:hypothetical protein n=1 Tax=Methanoculleus sp. 7T TaxID=2937282 RepID=UPI0020C0BB7F|nr:hypothetical protein [Methanoculleus sp. 7T]MCK8518437.1 hypothetical protein [Methanoculleus sp. 7T]
MTPSSHEKSTRLKRYLIAVVVIGGVLLGCYVAVASYIAATILPDDLLLYEVMEETAREGVVIRLDEEMFRVLPVLDTILRGEGHSTTGGPYHTGDIRLVGSVEYPEKIYQGTIDTYIIDTETGKRKYFEYEGRYYRVGTVYRD